MAKSKRYGGLIFLMLIIAAAAGGGWYYFKSRGQKPPEFVTVKVARGDITQTVTATGDLQPVITVDVGAQVSGQITEVLVDFNSRVKAGDVLAKIDESTPTQRLRQAKADLESAEASNKLIQLNVARTKDLFEKKLVSQQELDNISAQLAQSNATLLTRKAAVANAQLDLERCTIRSPIDGMVLERKTDIGRTVNSSMNAPTLFTLVNDLRKMQINAAVAEADVGLIAEGQPVRFTVDAYPGRTFNGTVRMVRNAASVTQSVVSYATIIDVSNEDSKLKPGMTANVSVVVQQRPNVLRIANGALRVRVPKELLVAPPASESRKGVGKGAVATMSAEQITKAKQLAKEKGLDPDLVAARMSMPGARKMMKGGGDGSGRRGGGGGAPAGDRGFTNIVAERTLYKFVDPTVPDKEKRLQPVVVKLGISDGFFTEVLGGLSEGDIVVTGVTLPGATPTPSPAPGGSQNPFSGRGGFRTRGG